ncbi:MAG: rhodanese-like domain-containing protein [Deltaproteobacteria bacterium]|nr:rhodanese-like domain-containing protein [Deltaproteobacteria bacterium]MBW2017212.1 rhodanese-like domain-containing protein [Deltaproteobacteria bacterium]MBW2129286.1 rhodanese-like domain-containing protein [Deltaproteobacteria bacterium]MBW2304830.1 rhodanese-like domain-containing protein [Deltaproteobacteria bacterium]
MFLSCWNRSFFPSLWQGALILCFATGMGLLANHFHPEGLNPLEPIPPGGAGDIRVVSLQEARRLFQSGKAFFLDARSPEDFRKGHLAGARSLPLQEFDRYFSSVLADVPQDAVIVTYCDGTRCPLARKLAEALLEFGFQDVRILENGWGVWVENNLPIERGNDGAPSNGAGAG